MNIKKTVSRLTGATIVLLMLGIGASAFAADASDGSRGSAVSCTLRIHSGHLLKDSCTAVTRADSNAIQTAVFAGIFNDAWGLMVDSEYVHGGEESVVQLKSYDRDTAAYAVSAHRVSGADYGNFFCMIGAAF